MTYLKYFKAPYMKPDDEAGGGVDERNEENQEVEEVQQEEQEVLEQKEESVPLKKYLSEKQRRKEIEKKLREIEDKSIDTEIINKRNALKDKYIKAGYDEELSNMLAEDMTAVLSEAKKVAKKDADATFKEDIFDLAESDSFYEDATAYETQLIPLMKKGFTAEEAYIKLRGNARMREVMLNKEQVSAVKRKEIESKKVATSTSSKANNPYPLDDRDKKALKQLQESFPDAGWTSEKYYNKMKKYKE